VDAALYEGKRVNAGHARGAGERDPRDTYAYLEGLSKEPDGLYARRLRLLNPKGDFEQRLMSAAENAPHLYGLSHTARGREKVGSGGAVIESVESVESVDLVTDPATVSGFYESRGYPVKRKLKELAESLKPKRPRYAKKLWEVAEAGIMSPDAPMDAPASDEPAADESGDHEQALMDAAKAVLDDDSLSTADKLKKIKQILKMVDGGGADTADAATEESRRRAAANLQEELARLKAEKVVRREASAAGVSLSETLVEAVARPGMTEAQAKAVVNELKGAGGSSQRPKSAGPLPQPAGDKGVQESRDKDKAEIPQDAKSRAAWLRKG
jgi:uncharacterized protein YbjQ (UPF0145 family)